MTHQIRIQETFKEQKEKARKQRLTAMLRERQINEELSDPHTRIMSKRIDHLEKQLKSINRGKPRTSHPQRRHKSETLRHRRGNHNISKKKGETPSPFPKGRLNPRHVRRPPKRNPTTDIRPKALHRSHKHKVRQIPEGDTGNQRPRRPSTNTTRRSESIPKRSPKRRN